MTHYYLYIQAGQTLDTCTAFFKVGVGESERQLWKLALLKAFAYEHGHFFVIWSPDAVDFMVKCQRLISHDANYDMVRRHHHFNPGARGSFSLEKASSV